MPAADLEILGSKSVDFRFLWHPFMGEKARGARRHQDIDAFADGMKKGRRCTGCNPSGNHTPLRHVGRTADMTN
jgi:hypothetical protein